MDAFCSHYHPDIEVFDASGTCTLRGMPDFRARYAEMFASHRDVRGIVDQQIILPPHIVERETWSRVSLATGVRTEGVVLVRYTEQDGKIRFAEFLRP